MRYLVRFWACVPRDASGTVGQCPYSAIEVHGYHFTGNLDG